MANEPRGMALSEITRAIAIGPLDGFALWNLLYLILFSAIFFIIGVALLISTSGMGGAAQRSPMR